MEGNVLIMSNIPTCGRGREVAWPSEGFLPLASGAWIFFVSVLVFVLALWAWNLFCICICICVWRWEPEICFAFAFVFVLPLREMRWTIQGQKKKKKDLAHLVGNLGQPALVGFALHSSLNQLFTKVLSSDSWYSHTQCNALGWEHLRDCFNNPCN